MNCNQAQSFLFILLFSINSFLSAQTPFYTEDFSSGAIPAYTIADLSFSYAWKMLKLEAGSNNLFNEYYFKRRATGYPGPGIIPSAPRTYYGAIQLRLSKKN